MNHQNVISLPAGNAVSMGDIVTLNPSGNGESMSASTTEKEKAIGAILHDADPAHCDSPFDIHLFSGPGICIVKASTASGFNPISVGDLVGIDDGDDQVSTSGGRILGLALDSLMAGDGLIRMILTAKDVTAFFVGGGDSEPPGEGTGTVTGFMAGDSTSTGRFDGVVLSGSGAIVFICHGDSTSTGRFEGQIVTTTSRMAGGSTSTGEFKSSSGAPTFYGAGGSLSTGSFVGDIQIHTPMILDANVTSTGSFVGDQSGWGGNVASTGSFVGSLCPATVCVSNFISNVTDVSGTFVKDTTSTIPSGGTILYSNATVFDVSGTDYYYHMLYLPSGTRWYQGRHEVGENISTTSLLGTLSGTPAELCPTEVDNWNSITSVVSGEC